VVGSFLFLSALTRHIASVDFMTLKIDPLIFSKLRKKKTKTKKRGKEIIGFLSSKGNLFYLVSLIPPGINQPPDLSSHKVEVCPYRLVVVFVRQSEVVF